MTCNSCNIANGFGRKRKRSRKAKRKISRRRIINAMDSIKLIRRPKRRSMKRKSKRRSTKRRSMMRRSFGSEGPGYVGQTSYENVYAPYYGSSQPFINPSEYYLPQANGQIQSPHMLYRTPGNNFPGN